MENFFTINNYINVECCWTCEHSAFLDDKSLYCKEARSMGVPEEYCDVMYNGMCNKHSDLENKNDLH